MSLADMRQISSWGCLMAEWVGFPGRWRDECGRGRNGMWVGNRQCWFLGHEGQQEFSGPTQSHRVRDAGLCVLTSPPSNWCTLTWEHHRWLWCTLTQGHHKRAYFRWLPTFWSFTAGPYGIQRALYRRALYAIRSPVWELTWACIPPFQAPSVL